MGIYLFLHFFDIGPLGKLQEVMGLDRGRRQVCGRIRLTS